MTHLSVTEAKPCSGTWTRGSTNLEDVGPESLADSAVVGERCRRQAQWSSVPRRDLALRVGIGSPSGHQLIDPTLERYGADHTRWLPR